MYERTTRVAAPLSEVWSFHSRVDGLKKLTPGFMNLRVEALRGPDGDLLAPEAVLLEGSELDLSMRPFGVGPRQHFTSRIVTREEGEGSAWFRDVMTDGPFDRWEHTHIFYADDGETILRDRLAYELPLGILGDLANPFAVVGFDPMFRMRHRETKRLLE